MISTLVFAATLLSAVSADSHATITARAHHDLALAARATQAAAANSPLPLTQYTYAYSDIPYQVNPYPVLRGPQAGYNRCNSTTEGPTSECQTAVINSISDFCLWGSPIANDSIGNVEAAVVAYCTKNTHGGRQIPGGAITAVQWMRTSAYVQITGRIDQTVLGLAASDTGGELDPHGADLLGNPLGGLVYSSGLPSAKDNTTLMQVIEWNNFIGGGIFCFKLCDPTIKSPNYCQNIFDLLGCSYNMPASYTPNEFTSCEGDLQDEVGTYTGADGKTTVWSQPASLPATSTLPWTPRIPASSNCVTYQSTNLFLAATTTSTTTQATATSATASQTSSGAGGATTTSGSTSGNSTTTATKSAATPAFVAAGSVLALALGGAFLVGGALAMA